MRQTRHKDEHGNFYWKFDRVEEVEVEPIGPEKPEPVKKPVKKRR